jgi:PAS domain S-box-containing protein
MRGGTAEFPSFASALFDETAFEAGLTGARMPVMVCWYWILKLQAHFISCDFETARAAARKAGALVSASHHYVQWADYVCFAALSIAALHDHEPMRADELDELREHLAQLREWADACPATFLDKYTLVAAEIARLEAREADAMRLYEEAIRAARENGFVHSEAIANEVAARFYAARGFEKIAYTYLRDARYGYVRWGAEGKVQQLDQIYPHLREEERPPGPTGTIGTSVEHLDLATVIKVSQAVSGEIVLEKLIDTLLGTAIEQAGAERGLLILSRGTGQRIAAEARTRDQTVTVHLRDEPAAEAALPESVLRYVLRTRETVVLDDATAQNPFSADPYIGRQGARSVLCLPLITQAKLIGVLYLENSLAPGVFAPARIAVLKLIASQSAIALENSRLYGDLREREAKIRRLVESNIIGIFIWNLEGQIFEANDAFLRMIEYDRDDLIAGRLRWTDLTPPEWRDRDEQQLVPELKMTGSLRPFEKEYFRKDGSRVPVLVGAAMFEEGGNQGVAFVVDLTDRKRVEAEARESERRYNEVRTELAHANRVSTMGQLTASIAHEVSQPIAGASASGYAALRWLRRETPDVEGACQAIERVIRDADRAGAVIQRIRALIRKAPIRSDRFDINDAIRDVIVLTRVEAAKIGISVQVELAGGLPVVDGDRVELQQVILNLIINAIEAMAGTDEGSRELVIATARAEPNGVVVAVKDSGPGLDTAGLERVFDAFYTTKPTGLGMGLSICRSIVEAHGGRLIAVANAPRGAIFQFTLPAGDEVNERAGAGGVTE